MKNEVSMVLRAVILVIGPGLLIAGCWFLTVGRPSRTVQAAPAVTSQQDFDLEALEAGAENGLTPPSESTEQATTAIAIACDERARELTRHLDESNSIIVRTPFVIAGDLSEAELGQHYSSTILPTTRALKLAFFDYAPDKPITLLLYSDDRSYRDAARKLDRRNTADYHGYYIRTDRRIVLNTSTGDGTLAHELTHALAHFDFPNMPEWFDEGLASVYEEAEFSDDGLQLVGQTNWRLNHLLHAMQNRRLGTLESLVASRKVDENRQAVTYAYSRYFCLYLQERGLLPFFYRKFRGSAASDPSGIRTLCEIFGTENLDPVDREFRQWVIALYRQISQPIQRAEVGRSR